MTTNIHEVFTQKSNADQYDEKFAALRPIKDCMHLSVQLHLLDSKDEANVLCVGAGTGAEILFLAEKFPKWRFMALDPAESMLDNCKAKLKAAGFIDRCSFKVGYVDSLPLERSYDIATSFMVSHFVLERKSRVAFFKSIADRLKPEGELFTSDLAYEGPPSTHQRQVNLWIKSWELCGMDHEDCAKMSANFGTQVSIETVEGVESIIEDAGFQRPSCIFHSILAHAWFAKRA